jgi:hypothetical protein
LTYGKEITGGVQISFKKHLEPLAGLFIEPEGAPVEVFGVAAVGALFQVAKFPVLNEVSDTVTAGAESAGFLQRFR